MSNTVIEDMNEPTTLQEALNIIRFLTTSHKIEVAKLKESNRKQAGIIKKLETNRKRELEFLSSELCKYEMDLSTRTDSVSKQLAERDLIIEQQSKVIEELSDKLKYLEAQSSRKSSEEFSVPEITILNVDSNSDSGIAVDNEETMHVKSESETMKPEPKTRKGRRFADSISFLRRVDFSPIKYKPSFRDNTKTKKDESRKNSLDIPSPQPTRVHRKHSVDAVSDDDRISLGPSEESFQVRPSQMNDSMNNHFSDDGSEDTSEEAFDRVMVRSSLRKSAKCNPKYKKINRTKAKLLEQVKVNLSN